MNAAESSIDEIAFADVLTSRSSRSPNYSAENTALASLAREMIESPAEVLQKLANLALSLCDAGSAGISILQPDGQSEYIRWHAAAGAFASNLNLTSPRDAVPCGTALARNRVLLLQDADRFFPLMRSVGPRVHEGLLAPWSVMGKPFGTVWAFGHTPEKQFDAEDARVLTSLASFASVAYQMITTLDKTNERLNQEIAQRRQTEADLRQTQQALAADLLGMRRLYELHAKLAVETDLCAALDQILAAACKFTNTELGCVQLLSEDGARLEMVAHLGYGPDSRFVEHFRFEGFAQGCDVARVERRRLIIDDTSTCPGLIGTKAGEAAAADGIRATQSTPMVSHKGETVGVLSTQFRQPHRSSDEELRMIDLLAWAAADFVERYQSQRSLLQSEQRQTFLLKLSDALRPLTDPVEIQSVVSRLLGEHLTVNRVLIVEFIGDEFLVQRDYASGVPSIAGRYPMAAFGEEHLRIHERGEAFVVNDQSSDPRLQPAARTLLSQTETAAFICTGLFRNGKIFGAFGIHSRVPRVWSAAEVALAREVAEHARSAMERARTEEALKETDRRKDEFLATLAHELRNPLAPISNAVQLLLRAGNPVMHKPLVEMIGRQVRQIVKLVDDLLEVSRIAHGKVKLNKQPVALAEVVRNAIETSGPLLDEAQHRFTVSLPNEPLFINADAVRLTQVLTNLVNNAAKYTDAGGDISLTARLADDQVVISVRDNGVGLTAGQVSQVFDLFTQFHRFGSRSQGGLGIGLTMVRDLVELHGGTTQAISPGPGLGSEFIVTLPALDRVHARGSRPDSDQQQSRLSGQRVLVVDDNRDAADSLGQLLAADGAEVYMAYEGRRALELLKAKRPTTVLLDLGMPEMDGYEVARQIRNDSKFHDVRIIALTGWGQETDRKRTASNGFDGHLTKPVEYVELVELLLS